MRRVVIALALTVGIVLSGGSVAVAKPAATIRCAAADASKRRDGSYDLLVGYTNYPRYSGRPFSFKLTVAGSDLTGGVYYKTYTYTGTPRSFHTGKISSRYPRWHSVQAWQSGTKCATAVR